MTEPRGQLMVYAELALGGRSVVVVDSADQLYDAVITAIGDGPTATVTVRRASDGDALQTALPTSLKAAFTMAPFTADQVASFNAYQRWSESPFTCPHQGHVVALVATLDGVACEACDYAQAWCHAPMADWSWRRFCDHKFVDSTTCLKCGWSPEFAS